MAHIVFTLAEWCSIAQELGGRHNSVAPAGLNERLHALVREAPPGWQDEPFALELDESSSDAVWYEHAALTGRDPRAREHEAGVSQAARIVQLHQRQAGEPSARDQETP